MLGNLFLSLDSFMVKVIPDLSSLQVTYFRAMALLLINYAILRAKNDDVQGSTARVNRLLIFRGFVGFFMSSFYYTGLSILPFSEGIVIFFTNPIIMTLLAACILGEPLELKDIITCICCIFGVILVIKPNMLIDDGSDGQSSAIDLSSGVMIFGIFCILAAATGRATAGIVVRKLR